jgi:hypothetical protein
LSWSLPAAESSEVCVCYHVFGGLCGLVHDVFWKMFHEIFRLSHGVVEPSYIAVYLLPQH